MRVYKVVRRRGCKSVKDAELQLFNERQKRPKYLKKTKLNQKRRRKTKARIVWTEWKLKCWLWNGAVVNKNSRLEQLCQFIIPNKV